MCVTKSEPGSAAPLRDLPELSKSGLLISWTCSRIALLTFFVVGVCEFLTSERENRETVSVKTLKRSGDRLLAAETWNWIYGWIVSVMYIMSAVMNQSAPYQKDQFLLRFYILICYAILYFLEKRSVATHISLFYSLRNIFSIVCVQEDILFEKAKIQNRAELGFLKIITKTYTLLYMDLSATYKWKDDYFLWLFASEWCFSQAEPRELLRHT